MADQIPEIPPGTSADQLVATLNDRIRKINLALSSLSQSQSGNTPTWLPLTLKNGWSNFGSGYATASYYKDADGWVHVHGLIAGGTHTDTTVLFQLPSGYTPTKAVALPASGSNGTTSIFAEISIQATGVAQIYGLTSSVDLSLECSFPTF